MRFETVGGVLPFAAFAIIIAVILLAGLVVGCATPPMDIRPPIARLAAE